ncbi:hypothetical protein ASPZODRAFT_144361 [Penicilliopsis zonata CBS 506.65]|uniref:Ketoreductase (KR) domain-containing protein n=1 Tax=Penicilliopsis zonata CBS 506.65 TaxID=1073090 RepID=A0A1L9SD64_9EURO|nr:hypothetical protein ASPZODRAFT_144361 [Penicilliopsis zonata CBS 506.65]OJJ45053.1 hypothetical protein ASPZODRAFT_144361 [Penicilliopsis zonata CBS 506.65]
MPSISGQKILILGGTSGIGFAVANLALAEQVAVTVASSSSEKVAHAVDRLRASFADGHVAGQTIDLASDDELEARLKQLLDDITDGGSNPLDHIVTTAGNASPQKTSEITQAIIRGDGKVPVTAVALLLGKLAPKYLKQHYTSSLIFTSGQVAHKPIPDWTVASAYAAGLFGITRGLALELKPLRVNLVSPGPTDTEAWGPIRDQMRQFVASSALLGKPGSPEEVAEAYIYLMKNGDATGSNVDSNGGSLLR